MPRSEIVGSYGNSVSGSGGTDQIYILCHSALMNICIHIYVHMYVCTYVHIYVSNECVSERANCNW